MVAGYHGNRTIGAPQVSGEACCCYEICTRYPSLVSNWEVSILSQQRGGRGQTQAQGSSFAYMELGVLIIWLVKGVLRGVGSIVCVGRWKENCQMAMRIPRLPEGKKNVTHWHKKAANFIYGSSNCIQAKSVTGWCGEDRGTRQAFWEFVRWQHKEEIVRSHGRETLVNKTIWLQGVYSPVRKTDRHHRRCRLGWTLDYPRYFAMKTAGIFQANCVKSSQFKINF